MLTADFYESPRRVSELYFALAGLFLSPDEGHVMRLKSAADREDLDCPPDAAEFSALFEGMCGSPPPLWESALLPGDGLLCGGLTLDVKRAYRRAGFRVRDELRQPADHIGIECDFFAFLCQTDNAAAADFLKKHLRPFSLSFAKELEGRAQSAIYRLAARFLRDCAENIDPASWPAAGIADYTPFTLRTLTADERENAPEEALVPSCGINNCGGRCPILLRVEDECVLEVLPGREPGAGRGPYPRACARGLAYRHTFLSADRLRYPMRRAGERGEGRFERISWDEALDEIASEWVRIKRDYGPLSRYINYSSGINAVSRGDHFLGGLLSLDGGYLGCYNSYSSACARIATPYTYGANHAGNSASDLVNSRFIILWGHNPQETRFGSQTADYLRLAKARGAEIVAVDPRRSDTALAIADEWIGIRPTMDCAFMAGMAYVILSEGLCDTDFMDSFCLGFDKNHMPRGYEGGESFDDYIFGRSDGVAKTPAWASGITGAPEGAIVSLARRYAGAKPAALVQGLGPQRNGNGEQVIRFGAALACMTGNVGVSGGNAGCSGEPRLHNNPQLPVMENPAGVKIPSFLWTDAVLRGRGMTAAHDGVLGADRLETGIKMLFNLAGDVLINQHSDIGRSVRILRDTSLCEFIVCSDLFMTPSARFADILLPGVSMFESDNIGVPWSDGGYLLFCSKVMPPLFESRFEYDWLRQLAEILGYGGGFFRGKELGGILEDAYNAARNLEPELPEYELFRETGAHYFESDTYIAFEKQRKSPADNPFATPSGKIEIFSPRLFEKKNPAQIPAIPKYVPSFEGPEDPLAKTYPLSLIGWHTKRRCHSLHDNNKLMEALEPPSVWIHPEDAEPRGIKDRDMVEIFNDRGTVRVPAKVTDRVIKGVCAMAQGAWYTPDETNTDTRGSINVLTTSRPTPLAKGNPQHSNLVEIRGYDGANIDKPRKR